MSNRQIRRRAKTPYMQKMTVEEFNCLGSMCAWEGCNATTFDPHKEGWSYLILHSDQIKLNFIDIDGRLMKRDACLCPQHSQHLDGTLLKPLYGRALATPNLS